MGTSINRSSRIDSIMSLIFWTIMSIIINMIYRSIQKHADWGIDSMIHANTCYTIIEILLIVLIVINLSKLFFHEIESSSVFEHTLTKRFFPVIRAIYFSLIWIVGIFTILDHLQINTSSILTGAGIGGALLAIASRDIITNLFGSVSILLSRTFEIGENIRVRPKGTITYEGYVEEITLNYTKITNINGEVVFMPNRIIYTETIENLSRRHFVDYVYRIPFKKLSSSQNVHTCMRIIIGKIESYDPIDILYETEIPNANDFVYKITVLLPEENEEFDTTMRFFLMDYIFSGQNED